MTLTKEELEPSCTGCAGYENEIFPLLGHLVKLGDVLAEAPARMHRDRRPRRAVQCLFMVERRPPKVLQGQADTLIRVLPALLKLLERETVNCSKHYETRSAR